MNWLTFGIIHGLLYVAFLIYIGTKRKFSRFDFLVALAHVPFILLNVVAPFRGLLDPAYAGYNYGFVHIPPGFLVTLVAGFILWGSVTVAAIAINGKLQKFWRFALFVDVLLLLAFSLPIMIDAISNMETFRIELGEYVQISGMAVALVLTALLVLPLLWSIRYYLRPSLRLPHRQSGSF